MSKQVTLEVHQRRLAVIIDSCGTKVGDSDQIIIVLENNERRSKPFSMWGKDDVPYSRIWFNRFEREGWLKRVGIGHDTMIDGSRSFSGTSFLLTEDGQEMLDTQADLLLETE